MRLPLRSILAAIAVTASTAAAPALAQVPAPTGGASYGAPSSSAPSGTTRVDTDAEPDGGLTVESGAMLGETLRISGTVDGASGVRVERQDPDTDAWVAVARATADSSGAFTANWRTDLSGRHDLRAVPDTAPNAAVASVADAPTGTTTVYRAAKATWYGPGFWGRMTACGTKLTKTTMGVAHKTLPCGTMVSVHLDGRQVDLPVIDRGPFAKGMVLDLTQAAAQSIGMTATLRVGWTVVADAPAEPAETSASTRRSR